MKSKLPRVLLAATMPALFGLLFASLTRLWEVLAGRAASQDAYDVSVFIGIALGLVLGAVLSAAILTKPD